LDTRNKPGVWFSSDEQDNNLRRFIAHQAVPQLVIPAKSHDLSWVMINRGTRAGIQNRLKTLVMFRQIIFSGSGDFINLIEGKSSVENAQQSA
jgi:hypothetical protein